MIKYIAATLSIIICMTGLTLMAQNNSQSNKEENHPSNTKQAVFASGCFWCTEKDFDQVDGVVESISGYAGGNVDNPSYEQVTGGNTGHREATKVIYNPDQITYSQLLDVYWKNVDPFDGGGQFCDRGDSYRPAILVLNDDQLKSAEQSITSKQDQVDQDIAVQAIKIDQFWPAEEYHQNYYQKNPLRYKFYRWNCGRDQRLDQIQSEYGDVF